MLLAWRDPQLHRCCKQSALLDSAAGTGAEDVRCLLTAVSTSRIFDALLQFRSVDVSYRAGALDLTLGAARMRTHLLNPDGHPVVIAHGSPLREHGSATAFLVDDLAVRGRSLLQRAG